MSLKRQRARNNNDVNDESDSDSEDLMDFLNRMNEQETNKRKKESEERQEKCKEYPQFKRDGVVLENNEIGFLRRLTNLRHNWGWKYEGHKNFERKAHENPELYKIVRYTDPLMWFFNAMENASLVRAKNDLFSKIKLAATFNLNEFNEPRIYVNIINEYLNNGGNGLYQLANYIQGMSNEEFENVTVSMYLLSKVANALIKISENKLEEAYNIMKDLKELIECYENDYYKNNGREYKYGGKKNRKSNKRKTKKSIRKYRNK